MVIIGGYMVGVIGYQYTMVMTYMHIIMLIIIENIKKDGGKPHEFDVYEINVA